MHPLNPVAEPAAVDVRFDPATVRPPGEALRCPESPLHAVTVQLDACVGQVSLTVGRLLQAHENEVLALDRRIDDPVDLSLHGRLVARGILVAVDGCLGVRLTEVPHGLEL